MNAIALDIKNLSQLKRTITVGTRLRVLDHWQEKYRNTERVVTKTQGNGFWFTMDGHAGRFWSNYEKSAQMEFPGGSVYKVTSVDGSKGWTMEVLG